VEFLGALFDTEHQSMEVTSDRLTDLSFHEHTNTIEGKWQKAKHGVHEPELVAHEQQSL